jgi:hypothetical protein
MCLDVVLLYNGSYAVNSRMLDFRKPKGIYHHAGIRTNHNESHSMLRRGGPTEDLHLLDSSAIRPKTAYYGFNVLY